MYEDGYGYVGVGGPAYGCYGDGYSNEDGCGYGYDGGAGGGDAGGCS